MINNIFYSVSISAVLVLLSLSNMAYALSATTANHIIGLALKLSDDGKNKLLDSIYFEIIDQTGDSYNYKPENDNNLYVAFSTQIKNVNAKLNYPSFFNNDIIDEDVDYLAANDGLLLKDIFYEWKNSSGNLVSSDSSDTLGGDICESSYNGDHTVTVFMTIAIKTEYGIPSINEEIIEKTFTVNANDGICYIQPDVLALNIPYGWPEGGNNASTGNDLVNRYPAFDSTVFTRSKGFKAWVDDTKFPTTGFPEARFRVVPYKDISNYSFEFIENPNAVLSNDQANSNSGHAGEYKFNGTTPAQGSDYAILVKNTNTNAQFYYRFALKPSRSWFTTIPNYSYDKSYVNAVDECSAIDPSMTLPTRAELTNSIFAVGDFTYSQIGGDYSRNNGYSRAIGEVIPPKNNRIQK